MNLTKAEIVKEISEGTGITRVETEAIVNAFITTIHTHLKQVERAARTAHNPKTGLKMEIPKRKSVKFRLSKELKLTF